MAGLRDGSLNINNLKVIHGQSLTVHCCLSVFVAHYLMFYPMFIQTGELAIRLTHSTERISFGAKMMQSKLPSVIYGGVTHLQCFPVKMQSSRKEGGERDLRSFTDNNLVAFASACTRGIVRVWRLEPIASSPGVEDWDDDAAADDGLSVVDQAMFEVKQVQHP